MEINTKENIETINFPLPIYEMVNIADATNKTGEKFSIWVGLNKEMVSQLKNLSLDESDIELQKNTSDLKRFGQGSYEDWYKKDRTPFALISNDTRELAALVWLGPKTLSGQEGNWHTIAWRAYPKFRGKGIMKGFTNFVIDLYSKKIPDVKISAIIKKENEGSVGFAQVLGFQELPEASDEKTLVMIKSKS